MAAGDVPRERQAELVSAGTYGTVLVLAAISVIGVGDVEAGHGAELIAGVGVATFLAHLFAELLGEHVRHDEPVRTAHVTAAAVDGSPILAATVLPAVALLLGRLDVVGADTARLAAIVVAVLQLVGLGLLVGRLAPARQAAGWVFAAGAAVAGVVVVVLTVALGH
ncbi:MAG TPA: hypothetical protein VKB57_00070 [Acidimicrobiales bacterium]|nr:hypothetical protein [Acidimicrobiales bacterium]